MMDLVREQTLDGYTFSTDKSLIDLDFVHQFLAHESYWALGIPADVVKKSIDNSVAIGVYKNSKQVGFARVITDLATFAYLADVFIDKDHRGQGLSKKLMTFILSFDELKGVRRMILATRDAHSLYAQFEFTPLKAPDRWMESHRPDVYQIKR